MHARMARMSYTGDVTDLARRAEEHVEPMFRAQPGFQAYSVMESNGEIFSLSVWETHEQAETASSAVAGWVAENMPEITVEEVRIGEILFSTLLGISTKAGATA